MGAAAGNTGTIFGADKTEGVVTVLAGVTAFPPTRGGVRELSIMFAAVTGVDCESILLTREVIVL